MPPHCPSILRLIDANLNRCSEGLRVIEDCCRFVLDDAKRTEQCKAARHALREAVDALGIDRLAMLDARDTEHDVGTTIQTHNEGDRSQGLPDLISAASKRAQEALRVIEESSKALGQSGSGFEAIRYHLYTIEKQVMLALSPCCPQWDVCVLITRSLCIHHSPEEIVKRSAAGGAGCIQIREKDLPANDFLDLAGELTTLAHQLSMSVIINDAVQIAQLVGADGVHLGQSDLPIASARALLGPGAWIGRTCSTLEHAKEAIEQGADYCGLGPVFESSTKPKPTVQGIELIKSYVSDPITKNHPMLAISGISATNIDELSSIGCLGVAVSSAVCSSEDPESVCRSIIESIETHRACDAPTIVA